MTEQLCQHIGQRQKSCRATEFIYDERLMRSALAKIFEDPIGADALVHRWNRANEFCERRAWTSLDEPADQILRSQDADDVIEAFAIDRHPRVGTLRDDADDLVEWRVDRDCRDPLPRHHQLATLAQVQPEGTLQSAMLVRFEQAAITAFR